MAEQDRLARLDDRLGRLDERLARLDDRLERLDRRLGALVAEQVRGDPSVARADVFDHQQVAERFGTFVEQDLRTALAPLAQARSGSATDRRLQAQLTASACRALFAGPPADAHALLAELGAHHPDQLGVQADRLCAVAGALRADAAGLGNASGWDFSCDTGAPLDPARQVEWRGCDPDAPIAFLVIPAYTANGRIYHRQELFTQACPDH